jgi:hypothetical protein
LTGGWWDGDICLWRRYLGCLMYRASAVRAGTVVLSQFVSTVAAIPLSYDYPPQS